MQWKYTKLLCTLWQRLGRAARDPSKEAIGVYIVEPSYTDHHRLEAEGRVAARAERAQLKQQRDGAQEVDTAAGVSQTERKTQKRPRRQQAQPGAVVLPPAGKLIAGDRHHEDKYEGAAMDAYINARSRGVCSRAVSDEFFDNRPGARM